MCERGTINNINFLYHILCFPDTKKKSPKLKPYPNWDTQRFNVHDGKRKLESVLIFSVDVCNRLWILDLSTLKVYDLLTDQLIREHWITVIQEKVTYSTPGSMVIDVDKDNCEDAYAYISSNRLEDIAIYSYKVDDFWRAVHNFSDAGNV